MRSTKKPKMKQCPCCGEDFYEDELLDVDPDVPKSINILPYVKDLESLPHELCKRDPRRNRIIMEDGEKIVWRKGRALYFMRKGVREDG